MLNWLTSKLTLKRKRMLCQLRIDICDERVVFYVSWPSDATQEELIRLGVTLESLDSGCCGQHLIDAIAIAPGNDKQKEFIVDVMNKAAEEISEGDDSDEPIVSPDHVFYARDEAKEEDDD